MKVNEITEKLNMYADLPYQCIFFNGLWGIGKSYAVDHVKDTDKVVRVSLSGVRTADEVYAEIFDAFIGKAGFLDVVTKVAKVVTKVASNIDRTKVASEIVSDVTDSFLSYKAALRMYFNGQKMLRVVVLDDFERVWDGIDITEVFKVVDFLTEMKNVKVAMVGDLTKLPEHIKEKFEKYSERYIEKTYNVTDISDDIDWAAEPLDIDIDFILKFKSLHPFHNLRSVIKANNFYKEVRALILAKSTVVKEDAELFWGDLRLTAFAFVIESVDKLKLAEIEEKSSSDDSCQKTFLELSKEIENRVLKYLRECKYGRDLIEPLKNYYVENELSLQEFEQIYQRSLKNDTRAYFYSDSEVKKKDSLGLKKSICAEENPHELVRKIKDYCQLCDICGEDKSDGITGFKEQFHKVLLQLIEQEQGKSDIFNTAYFTFILEKGELLDIVNAELSVAKELMIQNWIDALIKNDYTKKEFNISKKLFDYSGQREYKKLIEARYSDLLCDHVFPIEARNDFQYYTCFNVLRILHSLDAKRLENYNHELMKKDLDSAAKHRCECAMRGLKER